MKELKNSLENKILKCVCLALAIGEIKLFEKVSSGDSTDEYKDFRRALVVLEDKGLIDIIFDKTQTLRIVRVKQILH